MTTSDVSRKRRHFALIGGFRYDGDSPAPEEVLAVAAVGGASIDLTRAPLPRITTIKKISLVGGVSVRVPADAEVDVQSIKLIGGHGVIPPAAPGDRPAPVVRIRSYGVFGGVSVQRG